MRHERFELFSGAEANISALPQLRDKVLVIQSEEAELTFAQARGGKERVDFVDQANHVPTVGEISPKVKREWGIFRESQRGRVPCDISPMPDISAIRAAIKKQMGEKKLSQRALSSAAGLSESAVRDLLSRTDNPGIGTLTKIADALDMPVDGLTGEGLRVPIMGNIGAGGEVIFATDPDAELYQADDLPTVPRPPLTTGKLMALQVSGSSMLPKYEHGDVIYVRRDHDGIMPEYVGRHCAVRTSEGGTYLKILAAGSEPGKYTLRSLNAPDMENVEVVWATPVLFVMPLQAVSGS